MRAEPKNRLSLTIAALTGLSAVAVLAGWFSHTDILTRLLPGGPSMVPATALCFLLCAAALFLATKGHQRTAAQWLAVAVILLAGGRLAAYLTGHGAPDFLGLQTLHGHTPPATGRMSPATAFSFVLIASALWLTQRRAAGVLFEALCIGTLLTGWLGLARYVYGGEPLVPYVAMAIHTAALFMLLSIGTLPLRTDTGLMALLSSPGAGGASARRLLPTAVLLPLVLACIPAYAQHSKWLGPEAGLSLFALSSVAVFGALVWINAVLLDRTDEQRRTERADRERTELRTLLILENALDAVVGSDDRGRITDWNAQAERIFGRPRREVLGHTLSETIIPTRYRAAHEQGLQHWRATGSGRILHRRLEFEAMHRDGHEFPVELSIIPIYERAGVHFSAFVRDISARRQAEAALRSSERQLRVLAESVPNLVWTCNPNGECDYLSPQWERYTGRPVAQQLGYGWAGQLHPQDREPTRKKWAEAVARKSVFDIELRLRRHDGAYRWFKTRAVPVYDEAAEIIKWFGSNTDVDDTKRAEQSLRAQLERLALLDRTTRAIGTRQDPASILTVVASQLEVDLDIDFVCTCLGEAATRTVTVESVGANSAALATSLDLRPGVALEINENGLTRALQGQLIYEPAVEEGHYPLLQRLAAAGLRSLVMAPLSVENKVFGVLIAARKGADRFTSGECEFLRQLSEHLALALRQAELYSALQNAYQDLQQTQRRLLQQEQLRALGQMASGIAHDINNALSPASLYVQLLRERNPSLNAEAREQLAIVDQAIDDASRTVARIKDFYRRREWNTPPSPVDLNGAIQHVISLTRVKWNDIPNERGSVVEVRTDLAPALPHIAGAESEIRDALTNLVLNALDAMPDGGTLTLRTRIAEGARVCVDVIDTGIGMDEPTQRRCLEPFYTTKGERGSGLGLAMVYGMIERHSGEIHIDSTPGHGTRLTLCFPAQEIPANAANDDPAARQPTATRPKPMRILTIDDDPLVLEVLRETLTNDGHTVHTAAGGQEGIDLFLAAEQTPDARFEVVITDLGMPHVDGRKVAAAVKAATPQVLVILLTGWGYRMKTQPERPPHVDLVLGKPAKLAELRSALCKAQTPS